MYISNCSKLLTAGCAALVLNAYASSALAAARTVTVVNCDGSLLSSTTIESENNVSVKIISEKGRAETVMLRNADANAQLRPFSSSDSVATFLEVKDGTWTACNVDAGQVLAAEILPASEKSNVAMIGAGIVGLGSAIGIAVGGDSDNESATLVNAPAASSGTTSTNTPGLATGSSRDVAAKPVEVVSNTADCVGLKTLAATSGCRNREEVEPFSPYR